MRGMAQAPRRDALALKTRLYPETAAGGFSRVDGTIEFFQRVNALLVREMTVLDFGAGRGEWADADEAPYRRNLRWLRGKVARVVGCDVDPVVIQNPSLDEAVVVDPAAPLPFDDRSFDLIVADWVFEHISAPERLVHELDRVLKPGGWLCARTPNRFGYVALLAALTPNRLHAAVLRRAQPSREERDVFPTVYRMNTRRRLRRLFPKTAYSHSIYATSGEPSYAGNSRWLWALFGTLHRILPESLQNSLFVFLRKAPPTPRAERSPGPSAPR